MRLLALALLVPLLVACGDDGEDAGPPLTVPPDLVGGAPVDYVSVTVTAGGRTEAVTGGLRRTAVPLFTARVFRPREPFSEYGLDRPRATLRYVARDATVIELSIGRENFDGTGYYVRKPGDPRVFLVLDDQLDPLLALVS